MSWVTMKTASMVSSLLEVLALAFPPLSIFSLQLTMVRLVSRKRQRGGGEKNTPSKLGCWGQLPHVPVRDLQRDTYS